MARLSETTKNDFLNVVIHATFDARKEHLEGLRAGMALAVYQSQGADRVELLRSLPPGVLPLSNQIPCYLGGQRVTFTADTDLPQTYAAFTDRYRFGTEDPLTQQFEKIELQANTLQKEEQELRSQVRALLSTCSTDKQLLSIWPEAVEFMPKGEIKNLPAPLTENLNKLIFDLRAKK